MRKAFQAFLSLVALFALMVPFIAPALLNPHAAMAVVPLPNVSQITPQQYGAKADGVTDDAAAIQRAINAAQALTLGGRVYFPQGTYIIKSPITIAPLRPIVVEGDSYNTSIIKANPTSTQAAIFQFTDSAQNERFEFRNIYLNGNGKAAAGIISAMIDHTMFWRVRIIGTTSAAFSIGFGWDNDITECEASSNTGDGLQLTVNNNNAVNVTNSKFFANTGWGIKSAGGFMTRIQGCTIEQNRKGGIYLVKGSKGGSIQDCYFEANGQDGFTFSSPAVTVQAHVVVNGSSNEVSMSAAFPCENMTFRGNTFSNSYATEAFRLCGLLNATIKDNYHYPSSTLAEDLIGIYCDSTKCNASNLTLSGNGTNWQTECRADNIVGSRPMQFSTWKSDQVSATNYWTDDFFQYTVTAGGGGTIAKSSVKYNGFEAFDITGATSTDTWGSTIDVAVSTELANKLVYASCYAQTSATDAGSIIYVNNLENTTSVNATTAWRKIEMQVIMPASGTRTFRLRKLSGSSGTIARFTKPVIAAVGAPEREFYPRVLKPSWRTTAAPSAGTWQVGDTVMNSAPTAGSASGWINVTAGSPGTFKELAPVSL